MLHCSICDYTGRTKFVISFVYHVAFQTFAFALCLPSMPGLAVWIRGCTLHAV